MLLTVVLFLVALVIMTLFILSGMPGFLKLKRIQKLLQSEAPKLKQRHTDKGSK